MNFAYKRVSTEMHGLLRQEKAFKGIPIYREYCDKLSDSKAGRPQQASTSMSRISHLGRNIDDLRLIVQDLKDKEWGVHFIKVGFNTGNK